MADSPVTLSEWIVERSVPVNHIKSGRCVKGTGLSALLFWVLSFDSDMGRGPPSIR
jgi:hypothetical protein